MLTEAIAKNQKSIGVVVYPDARTGALTAAGTTFHIGGGVFVTADRHLPPALSAGKPILLWLNWPEPKMHACTIEHRSAVDDAAVLVIDAEIDLPALAYSTELELVGRSVFAYGFVKPECRLENGRNITIAFPRASTGIIGSRYVHKVAKETNGSLVYEADFATYPGETGAPVLRASDNVVVGIVRGVRTIQTPEGLVRGPTLVAPLQHLKDVL